MEFARQMYRKDYIGHVSEIDQLHLVDVLNEFQMASIYFQLDLIMKPLKEGVDSSFDY